MQGGVGGYPGTRYTEQEVLNLLFGPHAIPTSGVKTLTSEGTAVAIVASTTPCRWVNLVAIGGRIAIGDSSVVVTSGSERGIIIYPGNLPHRYYIEDLVSLYAAGATGTRLCFEYLPA